MSDSHCISIDLLKENLKYCKDTGIFTWNTNRNRIKKGDIVGSKSSKGYLTTTLFSKPYRLHRLAWFYVYEVWPKGQIDHINGVKDDNRISNLRDVEPSENSQNRSKPRKINFSKTLGVSFSKKTGKYQSSVMVNGKSYHLGTFKTAEEASSAYNAKKTELTQFFNPERI